MGERAEPGAASERETVREELVMKALKILGVVFGAIGLAVVVFYTGWLRAPSAEDVCDNIAAVTKKETGIDLGAKTRAECIRHAQPPEFGRIPWVSQMKCLKDARSLAEIEKCAK
jgi:hypothetical protein